MSPPRLANDAHLISAFDLLSRPNVPISRLFPLVPGLSDYSPSILERLSIAGLYKQHIIRQNHEVKLYLRDENLRIDESVDYNAMPGMSYEVRQRLNAARPTTLVSPPPPVLALLRRVLTECRDKPRGSRGSLRRVWRP